MTEQQKGKMTEDLLKAISSRLSSREDCRGVNYIVDIRPLTGVTMTPLVYVYPNRYRRKASDKMDIVSYIHTKFVDTNLSDLVIGTYQYKSSFDKKHRKWVKICD